MENLENVQEIVETVVSEEVMEAAIQTAEEIVADNSGNILKTIGKAGVGVAGVAGALYLGYKFIAKPFIDKKKAKNEQEELNESEEESEDITEEYNEEDETIFEEE